MTHSLTSRRVLTGLALSTLATTAVAMGVPNAISKPAPHKGAKQTAAQASDEGAQVAARQRFARAGKDNPNVLLITIDDAAADDFQYMPFTRKLVANRGVKLTNFVAPTPICVPSRASLLTGDYAHNHGMVTVGGGRDGSAQGFAAKGLDKSTIATFANSGGYDTFVTGKWMNGLHGHEPRSAAQPGWDRWEPSTAGTYQFYNIHFFKNGRMIGQKGKYSSDAITDRSTAYIRDHGHGRRDDRSAWFSYINYVAPHNGGDGGNPYNEIYRGKSTVPKHSDRGRFGRMSLPNKPNMWVHRDGTLDNDRRSKKDRRQVRQAYQLRVEALQAIDRGVRQQIAALRQTDQLRHTYVIVTSDNGFATGEHSTDGKLKPYREILTLPTVIRGPGIKPGTTLRSNAGMPDFAATVAAISGGQTDRPTDGMNILPMLRAGENVARPIPIAGYKMGTESKAQIYSGVVFGDWAYWKSHKGTEMYDTSADRFQLNNLAGDPRYARQQALMAQLTKELENCSDDSCSKAYVPWAEATAN